MEIPCSSSKASIVAALQAVKRKSGKTHGQIAQEAGLTNVYVAQLLRRQAKLNPETAPSLRAALPDLSDELLHEMMQPPMRSYDPNLIQEPTVYRSLVFFSYFFWTFHVNYFGFCFFNFYCLGTLPEGKKKLFIYLNPAPECVGICNH